jgi:uncharacterized protein (DUF924 family)
MDRVTEIIDFWFGNSDRTERDRSVGKPRSVWFKSDPDFDRIIQEKFADVYQLAAAGLLTDWQNESMSCLALIITLDQFPRNLFRGTAAAFSTDNLARSIAESAVAAGFDRGLIPVQRWFMYLPFEHSEQLEHQLTAVKLFETLAADPDSQIAIDSARTHYELINTFGRFPHRNQILGRTSTAAELAFLARPDAFHG